MNEDPGGQDWQGVPLSRVYGTGWGGPRWAGGSPGRRWAWQILGSVVWFAFVLGVFSLEGTLSQRLQLGLRYYLAEESSDWSPQVVEAWSSGVWLDSFDRWDYARSSASGRRAGAELAAARLRPLGIPVAGQVVRYFGLEQPPATGQGQVLHGGLDMVAQPLAPVKAAEGGAVTQVGNDSSLGRYVLIDHGFGVVTVYGLLGEVLVARGETVERGQEIGRLGLRAVGQEPTLHFEVRYGGQPVDPLEWLGTGGNEDLWFGVS